MITVFIHLDFTVGVHSQHTRLQTANTYGTSMHGLDTGYRDLYYFKFNKPVGKLLCALRGFPCTATICDKWHHRSHEHKFCNI